MKFVFSWPALLVSAFLFSPCRLCFADPSARVAQPPPAIVVARSMQAGPWEEAAAKDLAHYLGKITGSEVALVHGKPQATAGLTFLVGSLAVELNPQLGERLRKAQKKEPVFRSDAIVMTNEAGRIYLAGSNDDSHYFAVSAFLHRQGCRWYLPTAIGECLPKSETLSTEGLDVVYAPPFEVRTYWISWVGDTTDYETFAHRNFYNLDRQAVGSHELGELLPASVAGQPLLLNSLETVKAVVARLAERQAKNEALSLGISDSTQALKSEIDQRLSGGFQDKFFYATAAADTFLPFYNQVCEELWKLNPQSRSKVGFLAYTNLTLPPQRKIVAAKPLVAFLAPIDIDPNHALTDPRSPERLDFLGALRRWTEVMQGRVLIYDYDQGMMVWRDLPNPSHQVFRKDVKTYRDLGILGFATESRNAIATTFTNLHFRGQLMWNPELDVDSELALFYRNFYGPAAEPMQRYWGAIYDSFENSLMIDHEYYIIPALYPQRLVDGLAAELEQASADDEPYRSRLQMTRTAFEVLRSYTQMVQAGAVEGDYAKAVQLGRQGLAAREALTTQNGTFTTYKGMGESGPAWWPGEVDTYAELGRLCDGSQGHLVAKTPLQWSFREDPHDQGLWQGWGASEDFSAWRTLSSGMLPRAQGLIEADYHNPEGFGWYACKIELPKLKGGERLIFPGLFNSSWLYVNGSLLDWREQKEPWWYNDYSFRWDVDVSSALRPGINTFILRTKMMQHPSGMFRRPFLYRKAS